MPTAYWVLLAAWVLFGLWHEYDPESWQRWLAYLALLLLLILLGLRTFHQLPAMTP